MDDERYIVYRDLFPKHVAVDWEAVLMYVNATLNDPTGYCHCISDGGPPSYMSKWRRGSAAPPSLHSWQGDVLYNHRFALIQPHILLLL